MTNELETQRTGRRALVTGGAVRVGRSISLALGRAGYRVGVHYRTSQGDAAATVRDLKRMGTQPHAFRADLADPDEIRRMFEEGAALKQKFGAENVFDLSLGNPIVEPPAEFVRELRRLAENPLPGMHRYMPNAGYPETREAVAAQLSAETDIKLTLNNVIMTCGAAGALRRRLTVWRP